MIKSKSEYRAMLERVDDIGAGNPMASNIISENELSTEMITAALVGSG